MNKYLVCLSVLALCFSLIEAATRSEVERLIHQANQEVRGQEILAIRTATRDALTRATTQQQKICVTTKVGPANRDLNLALSRELVAIETRYRTSTPQQLEQLDVSALSQELHQRFSSAVSSVRGWVDQINGCA
nr:uncharacterized protein LOC106681403 [Halyomorpha halys]